MGGVVDAASSIVSGVTAPVRGTIGALSGDMSLPNTIVGGDGKLGFLGAGRYRAQESRFRPQAENILGILQQRVEGNRPSLAEEQLRQGMEDNYKATVGAIKSGQGISPALRARMLARAGERKGAEFSKGQAILRAGEQAQAESTLAQTALGAMGRDLDLERIRSGAYSDAGARRMKVAENVAKGAGQVFGIGGAGAGAAPVG